MKLKPKTELRMLAGVLLAVATILVVATAVVAPDILKMLHEPWHEMFTSQFYHYHVTAMIRETVFIISPCIATLNAWVAWKLLRYAKVNPPPA